MYLLLFLYIPSAFELLIRVESLIKTGRVASKRRRKHQPQRIAAIRCKRVLSELDKHKLLVGFICPSNGGSNLIGRVRVRVVDEREDKRRVVDGELFHVNSDGVGGLLTREVDRLVAAEVVRLLVRLGVEVVVEFVGTWY